METYEMNSAEAYAIVVGVMSILDEEGEQRNCERLHACRAALNEVARWLDVIAEVDEVPFEHPSLGA